MDFDKTTQLKLSSYKILSPFTLNRWTDIESKFGTKALSINHTFQHDRLTNCSAYMYDWDSQPKGLIERLFSFFLFKTSLDIKYRREEWENEAIHGAN